MAIKIIITVSVLIGTSIFMISDSFGKTLPTQDFLEHMRSKLPQILCQKDNVFRQCTKISDDACINLMNDVTTACIEKLKAEIPSPSILKKETGHWGGQIGRCVGSGFVNSLKDNQPDKIDNLCFAKKREISKPKVKE